MQNLTYIPANLQGHLVIDHHKMFCASSAHLLRMFCACSAHVQQFFRGHESCGISGHFFLSNYGYFQVRQLTALSHLLKLRLLIRDLVVQPLQPALLSAQTPAGMRKFIWSAFHNRSWKVCLCVFVFFSWYTPKTVSVVCLFNRVRQRFHFGSQEEAYSYFPNQLGSRVVLPQSKPRHQGGRVQAFLQVRHLCEH